MKQLLLIRHAKAEGHEADDFVRKLSHKGEHDAQKLAKHLKETGLIPQQVVASPAKRTKTTAQIIIDALHLPAAILNDLIYEADERTLMKVINSFNNEQNFIALVGHNPGISYLLLKLTGEVRDVHPGTAILVNFEVDDWQVISGDIGNIQHYFTPKH